MLASSDVERIGRACAAIANEVSDDSGFVSVRRLMARFNARLLIQPMLVEGMLASIRPAIESSSRDSEWAVLVDAETYKVSEMDVESETPLRPLPSRLRNTIAHELVHSIAFRMSEFGIKLTIAHQKTGGADDLVRAIERETERLSPLLLWSDKALGQLLTGKREPLSIDQLTEARRAVGISRYVLINRLRLLRGGDANGYLATHGLRNLAIGLAEWRESGKSVVKTWPLFANFDRNILPAFLRDIAQHDRTPAEAIFGEESFAMCGGAARKVEFVAPAGTEANPRVEQLRVQVSAETCSGKPGSDFLFVVRIPTLNRA